MLSAGHLCFKEFPEKCFDISVAGFTRWVAAMTSCYSKTLLASYIGYIVSYILDPVLSHIH